MTVTALLPVSMVVVAAVALLILRRAVVDARVERETKAAAAEAVCAIRFAATLHAEFGRLFLDEWLEMTPEELRREWPAWAAFQDEQGDAR